jgi:hypothetical protein
MDTQKAWNWGEPPTFGAICSGEHGDGVLLVCGLLKTGVAGYYSPSEEIPCKDADSAWLL